MPRSVLDCYLILKIMWHLALINLLYANATRFDIRQTAVAAAAAGTLSQSQGPQSGLILILWSYCKTFSKIWSYNGLLFDEKSTLLEKLANNAYEMVFQPVHDTIQFLKQSMFYL